MQGSLDSPPLIIRAGKWQAELLICAAVALEIFSGLAVMLESFHDVPFSKAWLVYSSFVLSICVAGRATYMWLYPILLTISPDGLAVGRRGSQKRRFYSWRDIDHFRLVNVSVTSVPATGIDLVFSSRAPKRWLFFNDVFLGGYYELPTKRLCQLLNDARGRWTAPRTS